MHNGGRVAPTSVTEPLVDDQAATVAGLQLCDERLGTRLPYSVRACDASALPFLTARLAM